MVNPGVKISVVSASLGVMIYLGRPSPPSVRIIVIRGTDPLGVARGSRGPCDDVPDVTSELLPTNDLKLQ